MSWRRGLAGTLLPALLGAGIAGLVPGGPGARGPAHAAGLVDVVLAEVGHQAITASDVALARALGLLGLRPSDGPIGTADVERLVRAHVALAEADRLAIAPTAAEVEAAWSAAAARLGGAASLRTWLADQAVEEPWARAHVERDLAWRRFVAARFAAFVFVTDDEVATALGPGPHPDDAVARARETLRARATRQRLDEWMAEALARTSIRRLLPEDGHVPCPLRMPDRFHGGLRAPPKPPKRSGQPGPARPALDTAIV